MRFHRAQRTLALAVSGFAAALLFVIAPTAARAQLSGTVVAENGRPLAGVALELWAGTVRLATMSTGPEGTFTIRDARDTLGGDRILTARKIGFRPLSRIVARNARPITVTLAKLSSTLDEVTVHATPAPTRDPCARRPTAQASTIFARAAAYYRDDTRWLDRIARYVHVVRPTHLADRDVILGVAQRGGWTRNAGLYDGPSAGNTTAVPRSLSPEQRLALPFPVPERSSAWHRGIVGWTYPRFYEWNAPSFVSRAFIDSMPKAVVSNGRAGIVLAFCPADRRIPYTSGEIQLGADSTIVAIRWHFTIAKPGEETGGVAIFAAPESKAVKAHLLPTNALTWTKLPNSDRFETTEYAYGRWIVAEPGDTVRVVPPRE